MHQRAAKLYRNEFAYHSMVIMQFDAASVLHRLGEKAAALAALEQVLRMDREYGFRDDARENDKLLLAWRGKPAGPAQIAASMRNFPERRATLKFAWHPLIARITFKERRVSLEDGQIVRSDAGGRAGAPHLRQPWRRMARLPHASPGQLRAGGLAIRSAVRSAAVGVPSAQPPAVDFKVSATGKFEGVVGLKPFAARLTTEADKLIRAGTPAVDHARNVLMSAAATTALALSPGLLQAATAERYRLGTAMWIGATLEQGVWYEFSAPLALPGMSRLVVQQRIRFAFTRRIPCVAGAAAPKCIEIVLHAAPVGKALHYVLADLSNPYSGARLFHYDASITAASSSTP